MRSASKLRYKSKKELDEHGSIIDPGTIHQKRQRGAGVKSIDTLDAFVLLMLYLNEPSQSLGSFQENLFWLTRTFTSQSTISRFFNYTFPIEGGFRKPHLVPFDKFRPENVWRAHEHLLVQCHINPLIVKYADVKLLKGAEVFCGLTGRNVLTGEVPPDSAPFGFRDTYPIVGFCGVDTRTRSCHWRIHDEPMAFAVEVEYAVATGFLIAGDVLVLNQATYHAGGENRCLQEWAWKRFGIFVLVLPAMTPAWNPQELVWNRLVTGREQFPVRLFRQYKRHSAAYAAHHVLSSITHQDVLSMYKKCNVIR